MEFQRNSCAFLRTVLRETAGQEQTLEVRIPDSLPDIGRVLGVWGQPLIRSKEWRSTAMGVTGGVMAWVLYAPEDGSDPISLEAWIPFQKNWEFPDRQRDGIVRVDCSLGAMDARILSARKLMLRAQLSFYGEALEQGEEYCYYAPQLPEDVRLLEETYPVDLPKEAGEKSFALDEELTLPGELTGSRKLLRFQLRPELTDWKVMGDKVVFRGSVLGHGLLRDPEGKLKTWDMEVPFSQYAQLDREYGPEAVVDVIPAVTNLETELQENGTMRMKAGLVCQYLVYDREWIRVTLDAYSPIRKVTPELTVLQLPALLEQKNEIVTAQRSREPEEGETVDLCFFLPQPQANREGEQWAVDITGNFQVLSETAASGLQGSGFRWEDVRQIPAGKDAKLSVRGSVSGRPKESAGELRCDVLLRQVFSTQTQIPMVCGLELGETEAPDPNRPSLILRRWEGEGLWELAKHCGTTVEAIREANRLAAEPEPGRMLLIPVP